MNQLMYLLTPLFHLVMANAASAGDLMIEPFSLISTLIIGFYVYLKRLPVILRENAGIPYVLCKAWAGLQGLAVGLIVWALLQLFASLIQ